MKKLLLAVVLGLLVLPNLSSAQTPNCTVANVHFDEPGPTDPERFSLKIYPPEGCAKPYSGSVDITTTGSYVCPGGARYYDTDVKSTSDAVIFTAKCSVYPHYIQTSDHRITVKFLPSTSGYYCNRTNPLMPKCEYRTTGVGNTTEAICSSSCKIDGSYYANISHRKVGQTEQKKVYEVGDKIEFVASTNVGGTNNRYAWNFGDAMNTSSPTANYSPVVYLSPGTKKVNLKVTNATGQTYISTSTELRVRCTPPEVPSFEILMNMLSNKNIPSSIAYNSFEDWSFAEEKNIVNAMISDQCNYMNETRTPDVSATTQAIRQIKRVTDTNQPSLMTLAHLLAEPGEKRSGHSVIALKVKDTTDNFEERYNIRILDSIGPNVVDIDCKTSKKPVTVFYSDGSRKEENIKSMYCLHPVLGFVEPRLANRDANFTESLRLAKNNFCRTNSTHALCIKRQNLSYWLEFNYPFNISNSRPEFGKGVCQGWSELVMSVGYLGDFVGECKMPAPTSASVGFTDLHQTLLKIREFLERSMPLLSR